ncbi:DUF4177 domain-containing protein [Neobacillus drentensis]|uniref:DUF4177 domain-containing protein n=1 Tax=Neobacillus drentensis TaxID=220684 RepID=UPI002FFEC25D
MYEHKFVKVDLTMFGGKPKESYQEIIIEHEKSGWELVQIFAPGTAAYGSAAYFEIILKRRVE